MHLETGTKVERYTVVCRLGEGGMASVYKVRHDQLGTHHALKVLSVTGQSVTKRLLQEGRVQASLNHPNILSVTDTVEYNGHPCLVVEYIDGPTLDEFLDRRPADFSIAQAEQMMRGIISGVAAAHTSGFVHRDLKPENVLLLRTSSRIVPKVADFGIAKALSREGGMAITRTGMRLGTPLYMAPEQHRNPGKVDERADVFSLGVMLYELVCGALPFHDDDFIELYRKVNGGRYRPPREVVPELPQRIEHAIIGALTPEVHRRIPSCEALLHVLAEGGPHKESQHVESAGEPSRSTSQTTPPPRQLGSPNARRTIVDDGDVSWPGAARPEHSETRDNLPMDDRATVPFIQPGGPDTDSPPVPVSRASPPAVAPPKGKAEHPNASTPGRSRAITRALLMAAVGGVSILASQASRVFGDENEPSAASPDSEQTSPDTPSAVPASDAAANTLGAPSSQGSLAGRSTPAGSPSSFVGDEHALVEVEGDAEEVWLLGANGRFHAGSVPEGTYFITASFDGEAVGVGQIALEGGETRLITCDSRSRNCE